MSKTLLIKVIILVFFIFSNIYGQQNTINTENALKTDSIIEDAKSGNVLLPDGSKEVTKDKPENSNKESFDTKQTQKTDSAQDVISEGDKDTKKTEQKQSTVIKPIQDRAINGNGLLEINDGDFKYKRIPGISLNIEKPVVEKHAEVKLSDTKELSPIDENKEKGIFGIKKSTAVILLLIVLIMIIIIFKIRSKNMTGKNVLRRFPGMK